MAVDLRSQLAVGCDGERGRRRRLVQEVVQYPIREVLRQLENEIVDIVVKTEGGKTAFQYLK